MEVRQTHFPYCIQKTADGRWIILNRDYKPLGITSDEFVTYETHPCAFSAKISADTARKLSYKETIDPDCIYLYADGCIPTDSQANMAAYLERLSVLAKIKHE